MMVLSVMMILRSVICQWKWVAFVYTFRVFSIAQIVPDCKKVFVEFCFFSEICKNSSVALEDAADSRKDALCRLSGKTAIS